MFKFQNAQIKNVQIPNCPETKIFNYQNIQNENTEYQNAHILKYQLKN